MRQGRAVVVSVASLVAASLLTAGCGRSVLPEFNAARDAALADPGPPPPDWKPDAVIHLSPGLVDELVEQVLEDHGTLTGTLDAGVAQVTPKLDVQRLTVGRAPKCDDCLQIDADLDGTVSWTSLLGKGSTDLDVSLVFDAAFEAAPQDGGWAVTVAPRRLRDLKVTVGGAALDYAAVPIQQWVDDTLLSDIEPVRIADLGSSDLPLRAVRIVPAGRTLQLQLLTASPTPVPVPTDRSRPDADWQLDLSQDSLLDLAKAAAFRQGEVGYDVVPEPTSLQLDTDGFTLGLRLWRIRGRGWWRDYVVRGSVAVDGSRVVLTPTEVEEGDRSPGAVLVDPLAALGEGVILRTIEEALATSVPATGRGGTGGLRTVVDIGAIDGDGGVVQATGGITVRSGGGKRGRR